MVGIDEEDDDNDEDDDDEDDGDAMDDYDRHLQKYVLVICGTNTGQHMFVPASALCNDININVDTRSTVLTR